MSDASATPDAAPAAPSAAQAAAATGAVQTAPGMYTVKIDGKEIQVDEAELRRGYSHSRAADERIRQATETRQTAEEVLNLFRNNPEEAFRRLQMDPKAFAEQLLTREIQEASLSPEQKRVRDLENFKAEAEKRERISKEETEKQEMEAFRNQIASELQTGIIEAIGAYDLPRNEFTVGRMAFHLEAALTAGIDASPKDIAPLVKKEYEADIRRLLSSVPDDKLLDFLGDDTTKKVVKGHIAKVGTKTKRPVTQAAGIKLDPKPTDKAKTPRDFFRGDRRR